MKKVFLFCLLISFFQDAYALAGSYKTIFSAVTDPNGSSTDATIANIFRPKYTWTPNETYSFNVAYSLSANVEKSPRNHANEKKSYRLFDLQNSLYPTKTENISNMYVAENLDRLNVTYALPTGANVTLGRQPVAFGSAKVINPTDVLTPFSYQELDKEERTGVDAIRINKPLGDLSLLDVGIVLGNKLENKNNAAFIRAKLNYFSTDISPMLMSFKKNILYGLDLSRTIGQASTWAEGAFVSLHDAKSTYFRGTIGADYKITSTIYSYCEFHYNGAGTTDTQKYYSLSTHTAYTDGGVSLRAKDYLIPGMSYEISPVWKLTGQFLFNANDYSMLNNVLVEHSFAQDIFIDLGTYIPTGSKKLLPEQSEFGIYPTIVYSSLRLYF